MANSVRLVPDAMRDTVQAVLPNWFRAGEPPDLAQTAQQDLLQAAVTGIRTLPLLTGGEALDADAGRAWAQSIDDALTRANLKALVPSLAVEGTAAFLSSELRNLGYRVVHVLTAAEAVASGRTFALENPEDALVVNETGEAAHQAVLWLRRTVSTNRLVSASPSLRLSPPASSRHWRSANRPSPERCSTMNTTPLTRSKLLAAVWLSASLAALAQDAPTVTQLIHDSQTAQADGKAGEAVNLARRAVDLDRTPSAWRQYGLALLRSGNAQEGRHGSDARGFVGRERRHGVRGLALACWQTRQENVSRARAQRLLASQARRRTPHGATSPSGSRASSAATKPWPPSGAPPS
jgi:hypothetical protein